MNGKRWIRWIAAMLSVFMLIQSFPSVAWAQEARPAESAEAAEEQAAVRLEEVVEKRSEYAKHYRMSDGTYQMVSYPAPVHYKKNQVWEEIDHTLIPAGDRVETRSSPLAVSFGLNRGDTLVSIGDQKDGSRLTFDLVGKQQAKARADRLEAGALSKKIRSDAAKNEKAEAGSIGEKLKNRVVFQEILKDTDLEYELGNGRLKESILIRRASAAPQYQFQIAGAAYRLVLEEDRSISMYRRADGSLAYTIEAPYMFDAAGAESRDIEVLLSESGAGYLLTLKPSASWINAGDRVFPVTLDPTICLPYLATQEQMASCSSMYSAVHHIEEGDYGLADGIGYSVGERKSLYVKFSLPPLDFDALNYDSPNVMDQPAMGSTVTGALLHMEFSAEGGGASPFFAVHGNGTQWDEGFESVNKPIPANRVESYMEPNDEFTVEDGLRHYTCDADITDLVGRWYRDPSSNNGLYITPEIEDEATYDRLFNVYFSTYDQAVLTPVMVISYISNTGLEDYWTYTSETAGALAGCHVNHFTGMLSAVIQDLETGNQRNGVAISHIYNDTAAINTDLMFSGVKIGSGWRLNIQETLAKRYLDSFSYDSAQPNSGTYYLHTDEDGTFHYFNWDQSKNCYTLQDDPTTVLEVLANQRVNIRYRDKTIKEFNNDYLSAIVDPYGNRVEISYLIFGNAMRYAPSEVREILSSGERRVTTLTWEDGPDMEVRRLSRITAPDGHYTSFAYSGDRLVAVTTDQIEHYSADTHYGDGTPRALTLAYDTECGKPVLKSVADNWTDETVSVVRNKAAVHLLSKSKKVLNTAGQKVSKTVSSYSFAYDNTTAVRNSKNNNYVMDYRFNNSGQTIAVTDSLGYSKYFEFGAAGGAKNKVTMESKLMYESSNILSDSGFQSGLNDQSGYWFYSKWAFIYDPDQVAKIEPGEYIYQSVTPENSGAHCLSAERSYIGAPNLDLEMSVWNSSEQEIARETFRPGYGERVSMQVTLTAGHTYRVQLKNVYANTTNYLDIDNVILNYGKTPEAYNMVEDGCFSVRHLTNDGYGETTSAQIWSQDTSDNSAISFTDGCVRIRGKYNDPRRIFQTIYQSGGAGTEILFRGSAKTNGIPNTDAGDGTQSAIALTLALYYTDGTTDYQTVFFEENTGER